MQSHPRANHLWKIWIAVTALAIVLYYATESPVQNLVWDALSVTLAAVVVFAVRVHRPAAARAWYFIAAGIALLALGDLTWDAYDLVFHREAPFPSLADGFYLGGYPFLAIGLGIMLHRRVPASDRSSLIDASIIAVGGAVVMWVVVGRAYALDPELTLFERLTAVAYPGGDLLLLGMAARLAFAPGARAASYRFITLALVVTIVGDTIYGHLVLDGVYETGGPLDLTWMVSYLFWGAAALHPSMRTLTEQGNERPVALTGRRLLSLVGASLLSPAILGGEAISGDHRGLPVMIGTSVVLFLLVVARMAGLARNMSAAALIDPLTRLPNRRQLMASLTEREGRGDRGVVALLFLDLDRFKLVNDSLGHDAGDELLTIVGFRIRQAVRTEDLVARLGGDEFVVVAEVEDEREATRLAARIGEQLQQPVELRDRSVVVSASIGVALQEGGVECSSALLRNADAAMYLAKQGGKARSVLWRSSELQPDALSLEAELRSAIGSDQLVVYYQPIVRVENEEIVGAEALVRWNHPQLGLLQPHAFLPLAEDSGLVVELGAWVLAEACRARQSLVAAGVGSEFKISVNLSPAQLRAPGLADAVAAILDETDTPPDRLCLEITENAAVAQGTDQMDAVDRLVGMGVSLAVDDFGTGFSSLANLRDLPVRTLKLDRSFVAGLGSHDYDSAVSEAVLGLSSRLGLRNVAEGVETPEQLAELRRLGCEFGQGFLWSPPVPFEQLRDMLPALAPL